MPIELTTASDALRSSILSTLFPAGAVMAFARSTAPTGWVVCDGAQLLKTGTYANLFQAIGTTFGETNGSGGSGTTHFRVPNLQGQFIRGWTSNQFATSLDPLSASRAFGNSQGDAIRNIYGEFKVAGSGGGIDGPTGSPTGCFSSTIGQNRTYPNSPNTSINVGIGVFNASNVVPTAPENRPVNIALLYCIKF